MVYCPKCGNQVEENMTFCPRCGAALKAEAAVRPVRRNEKGEKNEKREKQEKQQQPEKGEKQEKGQYGFIGWLVGGLVLVFAGVMAFLNLRYNFVNTATGWAVFLLIVGIMIVIVAVYFATTARKRSPTPV
jgi:uncharacterized membrane protein YvbJ